MIYISRLDISPKGYSTVTITNELAGKLTQIVVRRELSSQSETIKYATDTTLVHEDEITVRELIQLLAERLDELDESGLP